jgi:IclR family acetate operon transcriptional repressor
MTLRNQAIGESGTNPELVLGTLDKGLRVLEALAASEAEAGLTLTELSRRLAMNRTTLFRFLVTLRARGYVQREPGSDRYRLGTGVLYLASALLNGLDIRRVAQPLLRALRDQTQELVHLTIFDHGEVVTVERVEGTQPLSLQTEIGVRRPAYCTATGKAFLAYLDPQEVAAILAAGMPAVTARTITTPEAMAEQLAEVRRQGYAYDDEERIEGVRCVAAPVFGPDRSVIATISIAAPTLRMPVARVRQLGEEVCRSADAIAERLGYRVAQDDPRSGASGGWERPSPPGQDRRADASQR